MATLSARTRRLALEALADPAAPLDLLVVGGGITGVGIALDAVTRGLRVALVEQGDLASGTSRWSSKLVHGGLRYLAKGDVRIARESAVERHRLMTLIAPHLISPMRQILPDRGGRRGRVMLLGMRAADVLRRNAGTPGELLPSPARLSVMETLGRCPALAPDGLRGGISTTDGRLVDDARLVVAVARTAAAYGALLHPHAGRPGRRPRRDAERPRDGREPRRRRAHGRQRDRRVVGDRRLVDRRLTKSRNTSRRRRGAAGQPDRRSHRPAGGFAVALRLRAAGPAGTGLHRPHRCRGTRTHPRHPGARRLRDRFPARRDQPRTRPTARPRRRHRGLRGSAAAHPRSVRARRRVVGGFGRRVAPASRARARRRPGDGGRRQAHHLPADGAGRRRRGAVDHRAVGVRVSPPRHPSSARCAIPASRACPHRWWLASGAERRACPHRWWLASGRGAGRRRRGDGGAAAGFDRARHRRHPWLRVSSR